MFSTTYDRIEKIALSHVTETSKNRFGHQLDYVGIGMAFAGVENRIMSKTFQHVSNVPNSLLGLIKILREYFGFRQIIRLF